MLFLREILDGWKAITTETCVKGEVAPPSNHGNGRQGGKDADKRINFRPG